MKFLELKDIAERHMELLNPTTPEKIIKAGRVAGLKPGARVIDFGCGFAEPLVLWAEEFGITGVGIDLRSYACERAQAKIAAKGLAGRLEVACGDAAAYTFPAHSFDVAACIGATFIWHGFKQAVHAMRQAIVPGGRLVIGEAYWETAGVPAELSAQQTEVHYETELLEWAHQEGFDFEYVLHSNHDEWDRYEADNWLGLTRWIDQNPDHPERQEVIDHLRQSQVEYVQYGRMYYGWAIYVLHPAH